MRSDQIKKGFERAPHRSLLRAAGLKDEDFEKPFIGVANSHVDIIPGHFYLQEYGRIAKDEIRKAGGVPFEFNTIGVDDGIAMGHAGMLYSLPSRELIADSIETMMNAHQLDALVCIPNCDKIVPGMLMGALRVDVPTVFVSGGPMRAGHLADGTAIDLSTAFEAVAGPAIAEPLDAAALGQTAIGRSVDLAVIDRRLAESSARIAVARSLQVPDVRIDGAVTHRAQPEFDYGWRAGADVTMPLFTRHRAGVAVESGVLRPSASKSWFPL